MSDDPRSTTTGEGSPVPNPATDPQDGKRKGPSLARRLITWFFILILLGFTAFEWYTKKCFSDSLTAMENRYDEWKTEVAESSVGAPGSGVPGAGAPGTGAPRTAVPGAGAPSAGAPSAGAPSAGAPNAGAPNAGAPNAGAPNAGAPNAGAPNAGAPNAGAPNAGAPNAGAPNVGESNEEESKQGEDKKWKPLSLAASESLIRGMYSRSRHTLLHNDVTEYRWKSLVRTYTFYVVTAKGTDNVANIVTESPL